MSPLARRYCVYPRGYPGYAGDIKRLKGYLEGAALGGAGELMDKGLLLRTDRSSIDQVLRSFEETLEAASASSVYEPGTDTAFFVLEARVRRVLTF